MKSQSFERQTLNTLKDGFEKHLRETGMYFRTVNLYMNAFSKCFTTSNIMSYHNLKISQLKIIVEKYAKEKQIDLKCAES